MGNVSAFDERDRGDLLRWLDGIVQARMKEGFILDFSDSRKPWS
jgi:hypothetical protein